MRRIALFLLFCGCTPVDSSGAPDARMDPPDAAAAPYERREIVSGGRRVSGGRFVMDVQVGHAVAQRPAASGSTSLEGAATVNQRRNP